MPTSGGQTWPFRLHEETFRLSKAKLGPGHPRTLVIMKTLALAYWQAKQLDRSIPLFEEELKRRRG